SGPSESGREDLTLRPLGPEPSALIQAELRPVTSVIIDTETILSTRLRVSATADRVSADLVASTNLSKLRWPLLAPYRSRSRTDQSLGRSRIVRPLLPLERPRNLGRPAPQSSPE